MTEEAIALAVKLAACLTKPAACEGRWKVGANYFIRTVTFHYTGRLVDVTDHELWLEDAAWIADDGRFAQAVESGNFNEVEPYPTGRTVAIGRGAVCDAMELTKDLPRSQK